jgi:hypothetical protein
MIIVRKCEGFLKKHKQLYGKMPNLTEKVKKYGKNLEKCRICMET